VHARPILSNYTTVSNRWQRVIHQVLFDQARPAAAVAAQR
jgi:hypothetical protein